MRFGTYHNVYRIKSRGTERAVEKDYEIQFVYRSANTKCNFVVSMALEVTDGQTLHTATRAALIDPTSTYSIDVYDGKIWQTQTSELKYLRKKFSEIFSIMQKYLLAQSSTFVIESSNIGFHNWLTFVRAVSRLNLFGISS